MRTSFDLSPFYRSSVGFDRVFDVVENATRVQVIDNWPPYNIAKTGDDTYRITMAVPDFAQDELEISAQPNLLIVSAEKSDQPNRQYLHHGITTRSFTRRFELADHVKVISATLVNGSLTIELQRELPEALKPRRIAISRPPAAGIRQIIESKKAA